MKIHLDLMNTKDIKFTLTFSSAGEFRLFSPRAHWNRGVSRRPLFLRLWRHCWSFSSPLLLGFLFSLSLPPFTSAVVAAVSHPCPPHSRASRVSSPHWRHWAEFRSQDFLCKPTHPPTPPISCSAGAAGWTEKGAVIAGFRRFHLGNPFSPHVTL